jgi:hypothetical protein
MVDLLSGETQNGVKEAIKLLRIGAWFEDVRLATGQHSAYAVGKCVQPQTYRARSGSTLPHHDNLWAKYARGRHFPGKEAVESARQVAPGSAQILYAAAWSALDVSAPIAARGDELRMV